MTVQLPVPFEFQHKPIFSPQAQAKFLEHLSINGNVRLACKAAGVSAQTAYRARRTSLALAQRWDAALLSARTHAETVLAERALSGTEESVFYHGEEVATRIRYDSRLLLAHLARLDRLEERAEVTAALSELDDAIEALERGEALCPVRPELVGSEAGPLGQRREDQANVLRQAQQERCGGGENCSQDRVPCVPSCRDSTSPDTVPEPGEDALLDAMNAARPEDALKPHQIAQSVDETDEVEALQMEGFAAGLPEWWLITSEEGLEAALAAAGEGGVSCTPHTEIHTQTETQTERER